MIHIEKAKAHVGLAVLLIGWMSLLMAGGFQFLGFIKEIELFLMKFFLASNLSKHSLTLHPAILWATSSLLAFLLPFILMHIPSLWRRMIVWLACLALTFSWVPVLLLASYRPEIGVALIIVSWSGICAICYGMTHLLPVDQIATNPSSSDHGSR